MHACSKSNNTKHATHVIKVEFVPIAARAPHSQSIVNCMSSAIIAWGRQL